MNELLLSRDVLIYLFSETVLYLLLSVAMVATVALLRYWNVSCFDARQFQLEKRAYLVMSIVLFVFIVKIVTLAYFIYTLEALTPMIPGAMCAAGVVSENSFGYVLLYLKIIIVFISGSWILLNTLDLKAPNYPYFRHKLWLFVLIFMLMSTELFYNIAYFSNLTTSVPVQCCSAIYSVGSTHHLLPFGLNTFSLLLLYFLLYLLTLLSNIGRYDRLHILGNILFLIISYYAIVYVFGTYIYELPSHRCPFCMLQKEYYYIGYLIWGSLLLGTFFGMNSSLLKLLTHNELKRVYNLSMLFNTLSVLICSVYVILYYFKNGVLL